LPPCKRQSSGLEGFRPDICRRLPERSEHWNTGTSAYCRRARELFHAYVAGFGQHFDSALVVVSIAPESVKRDVARIRCREAFYLPHEPAPWKLLGLLSGSGEPIGDEIDARLRSQSA